MVPPGQPPGVIPKCIIKSKPKAPLDVALKQNQTRKVPPGPLKMKVPKLIWKHFLGKCVMRQVTWKVTDADVY